MLGSKSPSKTVSSSDSNNAPSSSRDNTLEELRDWYYRRSKEFTSSNYSKYIEEKKMSAEVENGYNRFEKLLETEKTKLHREFERKLHVARKAPKTKSSILNDYLTLTPLAFQNKSPNIAPLLKKSYLPATQQLRPEDFCTYSESDEEEADEESESEQQDKRTEKGEEKGELSEETTGKIPTPHSSKTFVASSDEQSANGSGSLIFSTTLATDEPTFRTSTPIKDAKSKTDKAEIRSPAKPEGQLKTWLQYFSSLSQEMDRKIKAFVEDPAKKELRIQISRTLASRINDYSKRDSSNHDFALLFNFLQDLFECKIVDGWKEGTKFSLDYGEEGQQLFVMSSICTRYLEQIKWEPELMEHISIVLVRLCQKLYNFYEIFCAKMVDTLLLLSMDEDKIISKIVGCGKEQSGGDTITQWVSNEQTIFRLFCKIQFSLKSEKLADSDKNLQKLQGIALLKMIFTSVAESQQPTILCTHFILGELLQSSRQLIKHNHQFIEQFLPMIKNFTQKRWDEMISQENLKKLDDCARTVLSSRHDFLLCLLNNVLDKCKE